MYANLQEMLQAAQQQPPKIIAIAVAEDEDVLQAAKLAEDAGLARFLLVGDAEKITAMQKKSAFPLLIRWCLLLLMKRPCKLPWVLSGREKPTCL